MQIVNIHGLAEKLLTSKSTLRKGWRRLPHFYVGEGRNLKSARFDLDKVVSYLETEVEKNEPIQTQTKEARVVFPLHAGRNIIQKGGVSNKIGSRSVGGKRKVSDQTPGRVATGNDPFNLCAGIKQVS